MNGQAASALLLSGLTLATGAHGGTPIRIGVSENDPSPAMIFERQPVTRLTGGLWKDLLDTLGREMDVPVEYIPLARKRMESQLQNGQIDMVCNTNSVWWHEPRLFRWTKNLSEQTERLVSPTSFQPTIQSAEQLIGLRIGTIVGYQYPLLEPVLAQGAKRIDQQQGNYQLRATVSGVVDVAIVNELSYGWWQKNNAKDAQRIKLHPLIFSRLPLGCALSSRSAVNLDKLDQVITTLEKKGTLHAIHQPYRYH